MEWIQSRIHHGTEKALVKVTNDLLKVYDCGHCCVFVLLDFSVALNTVDDVEHFMT